MQKQNITIILKNKTSYNTLSDTTFYYFSNISSYIVIWSFSTAKNILTLVLALFSFTSYSICIYSTIGALYWYFSSTSLNLDAFSGSSSSSMSLYISSSSFYILAFWLLAVDLSFIIVSNDAWSNSLSSPWP